jgi:ATP-dependent Zn protease
MTDEQATIESTDRARILALAKLVRVVNSNASQAQIDLYADAFVEADAEHNAAWQAVTTSVPAPIAAHHEAGHAVIGALRGIDFFYVTIKGTRETGGHCFQVPGDHVTPENRIVMAMAGGLAEAKCRHDPNIDGHDAADGAVIKKMLAQMPTGTRERCTEMAIAMVRENWKAITDVAAELVRIQKISGERLKEIMAETKRQAEAEIDALM